MVRSSRTQMFFKTGVPDNFAIFKGNSCVGFFGPVTLLKRDSKTGVSL